MQPQLDISDITTLLGNKELQILTAQKEINRLKAELAALRQEHEPPPKPQQPAEETVQ